MRLKRYIQAQNKYFTSKNYWERISRTPVSSKFSCCIVSWARTYRTYVNCVVLDSSEWSGGLERMSKVNAIAYYYFDTLLSTTHVIYQIIYFPYYSLLRFLFFFWSQQLKINNELLYSENPQSATLSS